MLIRGYAYMNILKIFCFLFLGISCFAQGFNHKAVRKSVYKKQIIFPNQTSLKALRKIQLNQFKHGL